MKYRVVLAGGGTAGHVLPALSIARSLVLRGHPASSIHFVGSRRGQEATLVPAAGFGVTLLPGRGVERRLSRQSLAAGAGIATAVAMALGLLARWRPAAVVSVGGYAALPGAIAAGLLRIPLLLCNLDAVPNGANRLVAPFAVASAVAFDGTKLPKAVVTGSPVRAELVGMDRSPEGRRRACATLGLPEDRLTVAVVTGSLGSARVNDAVVGLVKLWSDRGDLTIRHVVGRRDWVEVSRRTPLLAAAGLCYRPVEYEDRMATLLNAADVLVGRAGASTVAEVAAVGLASILVPLPRAPADHQAANARALERRGAAAVLADARCDANGLAGALAPLLADAPKRRSIESLAASLGHPRAADAIAEMIEQWAGRPEGLPVE